VRRDLATAIACVAASGAVSGGCLAYQAVSAPVKLAATGVVVAGEAATAVVTTTGKVAVSAANAVGSVGTSSLDSAARLTQVGMVTFVDVASGTIVRVPWREGLTLASAGDAARVGLAQHAIDVVRAGRVIFSAGRGASEAAQLASGDVVRLRG